MDHIFDHRKQRHQHESIKVGRTMTTEKKVHSVQTFHDSLAKCYEYMYAHNIYLVINLRLGHLWLLVFYTHIMYLVRTLNYYNSKNGYLKFPESVIT